MTWCLRGIKEVILNNSLKMSPFSTLSFKNGPFWPKTPIPDHDISSYSGGTRSICLAFHWQRPATGQNFSSHCFQSCYKIRQDDSKLVQFWVWIHWLCCKKRLYSSQRDEGSHCFDWYWYSFDIWGYSLGNGKIQCLQLHGE